MNRRGFIGALAAALPFASVLRSPASPATVGEIRGCRLDSADPIAEHVQAFREVDGLWLWCDCRWVDPSGGLALLSGAEPGGGATAGRFKVAWLRALPGCRWLERVDPAGRLNRVPHTDTPSDEFQAWAQRQVMEGAEFVFEVLPHPDPRFVVAKAAYITEVYTP